MPTVNPLPTLDRTATTFRTDVDTFFGTQLPTFSVEVEAARVEVVAKEASAVASAAAASTSASTALTAASVATSAANFKGTWSALAGALARPACVFHNGAFWLLLNDLANVAASQPGVSADWQVSGGVLPRVRISTNTTALPFTSYVITATCTLTLPAITGNGKPVGVVLLPGINGAILATTGTDKVRGVSGPFALDTGAFSITFTDNGATDGWV